MSAPAALEFADVSRRYASGDSEVVALDRVSLAIAPGEFVAIVGRSGSGKSTLLNLAAGIDVPTSGEVRVDGRALARLGDDALTIMRREQVGVVYQFFHLIPGLDVRENVALPLLLARANERDALARADALLAEVGLAPRARALPHTLSGGEMQRAAVARALVHAPRLLLADEPTGNLDTRAAAQVIALIGDLGARHGATVVMVTHSLEAASAARRVVEMRDGRVVADRVTSPA
ncbi:MAG: ABC transporter ATP-binding protein [Candidatus Eisenbacteria bacterium]